MIVDKNTFFNIINNFEIVPYTQSEVWCDIHSQNNYKNIVFIVNSLETPTIAIWGHIKQKLGFKMLLIEGECFSKTSVINRKNIKKIYEEIANLGFNTIEISSNNKYSFEYEFALRQVGFKRPLGQFSMPITKHIDLTNEIKYNQNWKRNLKNTINYSLELEAINPIKLKDSNDFLTIYTEMIKRKKVSLSYSAKQIKQLCNSKSFKMFFVKLKEERICTIIIHTHKKKAGLLYAATSNKALNNCASFFMYNELLKYLSKNGFKIFDMEKLVASTDSINSVFNFKNGIKGEHLYLNGEWAIYKNNFYRYFIYFLKKFIFKRREM